jgi:hypothetical protein
MTAMKNKNVGDINTMENKVEKKGVIEIPLVKKNISSGIKNKASVPTTHDPNLSILDRGQRRITLDELDIDEKKTKVAKIKVHCETCNKYIYNLKSHKTSKKHKILFNESNSVDLIRIETDDGMLGWMSEKDFESIKNMKIGDSYTTEYGKRLLNFRRSFCPYERNNFGMDGSIISKHDINPKYKITMLVQRNNIIFGNAKPQYITKQEINEKRLIIFTSTMSLRGKIYGTGVAYSKKDSEVEAAEKSLPMLLNIPRLNTTLPDVWIDDLIK